MKKEKLTPEDLFNLSYEEFRKKLTDDLHKVPILNKCRYAERLETTALHWLIKTNRGDDLLLKLFYIDSLRGISKAIVKKQETGSANTKKRR